jgi:lipid A 3-O-deacylase
MNRTTTCLAALLVLAASAASHAQTRASVVLEQGEGSKLFGLGAVAHGRPGWRPVLGADVDQVWIGRLAYWRANKSDANGRQLWDVSLVPALQLTWGRGAPVSPFAEIGIGAHLISHSRLNNRFFGSAFQFGEHAGVGVNFGRDAAYSVLLRIEHVSNGSITKHNDGMTFTGIELRANLP